jgi:hypothetical protein
MELFPSAQENALNKRARGDGLAVNRINHQATMVKKRLINLVNVALLSNGGGGMLVRVALVCACGLGAWILGVVCAVAEDLAPEQCFRVQKIDNRSFRGSVAGLDFAYCDFYQHNSRTHLVGAPANSPATPITTVERSVRLSFHE